MAPQMSLGALQGVVLAFRDKVGAMAEEILMLGITHDMRKDEHVIRSSLIFRMYLFNIIDFVRIDLTRRDYARLLREHRASRTRRLTVLTSSYA